jgi:hypothetical protein
MIERSVEIYDDFSNFNRKKEILGHNNENQIIKKNWDEIVALHEFECSRKCGKSIKIFYADSSISIKCKYIEYVDNNVPYCKLKKVKCHHRRI